MKFGSLFSGIEAASAAWLPLGWECAWVAETDPFACAVLKHHYPDTPNLGDVTEIDVDAIEPVDLLVAGTPCQDFSIAGLRAGLAGERGELTLEFVRLAGRLRPRWLVWENVPGVLSIDEGRAFGAFLAGLAECGHGFAYRVLDAQHFGVPQRRRRVFVVGHPGDWRVAAAVLFEPESLRGDPAPRRAAGQNAPTLPSRGTAGGGLGTDFDCDGGLIAPPITSNPYGDHKSREGLLIAHSLRADGFDASEDGTGRGVPLVTHALSVSGRGGDVTEDGTGRGTPIIPVDLRQASRGDKITNNRAHGSGGAPGHGVGEDGDPAYTVSERGQAIAQPLTLAIRGRGDSHDLEYRDDGIANAILTPNGGRAGIGVGAIAFDQNVRSEVRTTEIAGALSSGGGKPGQGYPAAMQGMSVRRLTPRECERLQGFPDDYTLVPYRGKPAADGPRYRALGNSMAVPCMRWIGERIAMVEKLINEGE